VRDTEGVSLDNTADVETPERIRFTHHVAGPVRRGLAYLIDLVIRGAILAVAAIFLGATLNSAAVKASWGLWLLLLFVMEWGWNVAFETFWRGRTIGKKMLGLRVVRAGGYPVGFIDAVLRNLLRAADFLPVGYVLGLLVMAGDRCFRRLGDHIAGTMVVIEAEIAMAEPLVIAPPPSADELEALPRRPAIRDDELEALELFLRRRHLSPQRRQELAEMIAPGLAQRLGARKPDDAARFLAVVYQRAVGGRRGAVVAPP
jgi:uncharacterized RDD family membrane protein YckC